jgi:excisionase family DNA binding protein
MARRSAREASGRNAQRSPIYPPQDLAILTLAEVAGLLRVSTDTVERFLYRDEMPHIDLGTHHPKRRRKQLLRFERETVITWARARMAAGKPGE